MVEFDIGEKLLFLSLCNLQGATQAELSSALGMTRSTVSRIVKRLKSKQAVSVKEHRIYAVSTEVLPAFFKMLERRTEVSSSEGYVSREETKMGQNMTNVSQEETASAVDLKNVSPEETKTTFEPKKESQFWVPPFLPPSSSSLRLSLISPPYNPPSEFNNKMVNWEDLPSESSNESSQKVYFEALFDLFWSHYPRKVQKADTKELFLKLLNKGVDPVAILRGLKQQIPEWRTYEDPNYIPYPKNWLKHARWEDEVDTFANLAEGALEEAKLLFEEKPAVASTPRPLFNDAEEAFLREYCKRPRTEEDIDAFHFAFAHALDNVGDLDVLVCCAKLYVEDYREREGDTSKLRRPHVWLEDCCYREVLSRARRLKPKPRNPNPYASNMLPPTDDWCLL